MSLELGGDSVEVIIPGERIKTEEDLHRFLAEKLDFGPYYGNNLAALWDRLTRDVERPVRLIWENSTTSRSQLGEEAYSDFIDLFRDVEREDADLGRTECFSITYA